MTSGMNAVCGTCGERYPREEEHSLRECVAYLHKRFAEREDDDITVAVQDAIKDNELLSKLEMTTYINKRLESLTPAESQRTRELEKKVAELTDIVNRLAEVINIHPQSY